jgi:hypothetical protein
MTIGPLVQKVEMDINKQHSCQRSLLFLPVIEESGLTEVKQQDAGLDIEVVAGRSRQMALTTPRTPFKKLLPMPQAVSNKIHSKQSPITNSKQTYNVGSYTFDNQHLMQGYTEPAGLAYIMCIYLYEQCHITCHQ